MEMVSKPCQDRFLYPILFQSSNEKSENTSRQKINLKLSETKQQQQQQPEKFSFVRSIPGLLQFKIFSLQNHDFFADRVE